MPDSLEQLDLLLFTVSKASAKSSRYEISCASEPRSIVLLFAQHGWGQAWLAFTVVSITFMAGRLIFGHLPDRIGGARVASYAC